MYVKQLNLGYPPEHEGGKIRATELAISLRYQLKALKTRTHLWTTPIFPRQKQTKEAKCLGKCLSENN